MYGKSGFKFAIRGSDGSPVGSKTSSDVSFISGVVLQAKRDNRKNMMNLRYESNITNKTDLN